MFFFVGLLKIVLDNFLKSHFVRLSYNSFASFKQLSAIVDIIRPSLRRLERVFLLLQWLWNDGRLQRRILNGVGKLYVSLQLYCWAILWGYLWRHISYHGNAQGAQKRPLNFTFYKLSEKLIWWPTIFISVLESSLNSLTFQTEWKKVI